MRFNTVLIKVFDDAIDTVSTKDSFLNAFIIKKPTMPQSTGLSFESVCSAILRISRSRFSSSSKISFKTIRNWDTTPFFRRSVPGLVIQEGDEVTSVSAIRWYLLKRDDAGKLTPNFDVTTFNARDLSSRLWKSPIETRRGLVFADQIDERYAKGTQYLIATKEPLLIACLYNRYQTDGDTEPTFSFGLITRDPHPRFKPYHEKSTPLFLPPDADALRHWLNPEVSSSDKAIQEVLSEARLTTLLEVTPVRSCKSAEATGEGTSLAADHC